MKKVIRTDILPLEVYESRRARIRKQMIALKAKRRVVIAPALSLTFENTKTAWYQIQEMLRAERIVKSKLVQSEINVYNSLVPESDALRATLFIEIPDLHKNRTALDPFITFPNSNSLWIEINNNGKPPLRVFAEFDKEQYSENRVAAVQYITFRFSPADAAAFCKRGSLIKFICGHPANPGETAASPGLRRALASELRPPKSRPTRPSQESSAAARKSRRRQAPR
ncbi:MAG: DUF3501 family protein [Planctomycetota bacterium]